MTPEEIIHACVGEIYRYRQAIQDQLPRVEAAADGVRAERKAIETDKRELLFAPSMPMDEYQEKLEAIHQRDVPYTARLKTEAQFLLGAVYGVLSMSKAIRASSTGELNACVQRAISAFEKAAPDADLLRHLHEHIDDYMRGGGHDRDRLPNPEFPSAFATTETGLVYFVGGKLVVLSEITAAAEELAGAIVACTM